MGNSCRFPAAMLRIVSVVVLLAVCGARPRQWENQLGLFSRAVANPTTANQVLDNILEGAVDRMTNLGWCDGKNAQNGESVFPFTVNTDGSSEETFSITGATVTGLCTLRRSKTASFNADKSVLSGTVMLEKARINAEYTVDFEGTGEAPAQTVNGQVTERVDKLFADIEVRLTDLVPQSIASYTVRSGHDVVEAATNMDGNSMEEVHIAGIRKALREGVLEKTMNSNVKVQINQAIQES